VDRFCVLGSACRCPPERRRANEIRDEEGERVVSAGFIRRGRCAGEARVRASVGEGRSVESNHAESTSRHAV